MPDKIRTCSRCGTPDLAEWCPKCVAEWESRRPVAGMTVNERLEEWDSWGPILEIPFGKLHERLEELAGRPICTLELAHPENVRAEIEDQR